MSEITEFQYPDGWYMRVYQVYSSPYEPYHALITRFEEDPKNKGDVRSYWVYYKKLNPKNYDDIWDNEEERSRAWWFNDGYWDLEKEPDVINFSNGSRIVIPPVGEVTRGKLRQYLFGIDLAKE